MQQITCSFVTNLAQIMKKCLSPNKSDRFKSANELMRHLVSPCSHRFVCMQILVSVKCQTGVHFSQLPLVSMAEELRFLSKIPMSVKEEVGEITELNMQVTLRTAVLHDKSPVLLICGPSNDVSSL